MGIGSSFSDCLNDVYFCLKNILICFDCFRSIVILGNSFWSFFVLNGF